MQTLSEELALKIVERLVSEKLLSAEDGKKILPKLAAGKLQAEDWRLPIEISEEKEKRS